MANNDPNNEQKNIISKSGQMIVFNDADGNEQIIIATSDQKNRIMLNFSDNSIYINSIDGNITINAQKGSINLFAGQDIYMEAGRNIILKAGNAVDIEGAVPASNFNSNPGIVPDSSGNGAIGMLVWETGKNINMTSKAGDIKMQATLGNIALDCDAGKISADAANINVQATAQAAFGGAQVQVQGDAEVSISGAMVSVTGDGEASITAPMIMIGP